MPGSLLDGGDFDQIGSKKSNGSSGLSPKTIGGIALVVVLAVVAAVFYWPESRPKTNGPASINELPPEDQRAAEQQQEINKRRQERGELTIGDS